MTLPAPGAILNIAAYRFVDLDDLAALRTRLRTAAMAGGLKGTILIAPEGINLFLAGAADGIASFLAALEADARFAALPVRRSHSTERPFNRLLVKIKREIITMHAPEVRPAAAPAPRVTPRELEAWLAAGREVVLLDTRNRFEVALGTLRGALALDLASFSDFPAAVERLPAGLAHKTVVTFCTGGIRCEKAAPYLRGRGYADVYQLDGGILAYLEQCGAARFAGECFVFDKRVALDANLAPTGTTQCYACQSIVTAAEQRFPDYVEGERCPHCARAGHRARPGNTLPARP